VKGRPVLLLDVDGVLNVVGPDYRERLVRMANGHPFHPTPYVLPFLEWAWKTFDVVWTTAWRESANEIADWARLPRVPALKEGPTQKRREMRLARLRHPDAKKWLAVRGDWKVDGARELLCRRPCPVFWLEDGLSEEGHRWVASRPRTWYLATDSFEGVTPAHRKILEALVHAL
jgi:hypothetical protein